MSREIQLTQDQVAIVDDADFDWLSQWKWCADKHPHSFYAVRCQSKVSMHRLITGALPGLQVDHRDRNGLNNQRDNLRICSVSQNHCNQLKTRGTSQFKGVCLDRGKWRADICLEGRRRYLGCFATEEEAARVYDRHARKLFGEFARCNFPVPALLSVCA